MAERVMLVCDTCGKPAVETVILKTSRGNRQRDYCPAHLEELLAPARTPKRGRKPGSTNAAPKKAASKKKAAPKKTTAKRATGRKRTGRKKSVARRTSGAARR